MYRVIQRFTFHLEMSNQKLKMPYWQNAEFYFQKDIYIVAEIYNDELLTFIINFYIIYILYYFNIITIM